MTETNGCNSRNNPSVVNSRTGETWVYSPVVKDHFFSPRNFLLNDPKEGEFDAVGMVGSPACGDIMKMWIKVNRANDRITDLKWQTFGSLALGTRIVMANPNTEAVENIRTGNLVLDGDGKPNVVERVFRKRYRGQMVNVRLATSGYYTFQLTPNHPVPVVRRHGVATVRRYSGDRWSEVEGRILHRAISELVPASDLKPGDYLLYGVPKAVRDYRAFTSDRCTLLGFYVSDGTLPSVNRVLFKFNLTEDAYVTEVARIARRNGWPVKVRRIPHEHVHVVTIGDSKLVAFLRTHGGAPGHKRFSEEVMALPPTKQWRIVEAYVKGDGWILRQDAKWDPQYFIATAQEHLANQLQVMIARNGIFAPIHHRGPKTFTIRGKTYTNTGEYNLIFRKRASYSWVRYAPRERSFLIPIRSITAERYNGTIYDLGLLSPPHVYRVKGISVHNCGSAIASTSMFSVMVTENGGLTVDDALKIKPQHVMERLGGLPDRKIHCSVLADKAFRKAVNEYFHSSNQSERITVDGAKVIDARLNITDKDIEEAVLDGARTLDDVQRKLKVGVGDPAAIPEIEQLIRFYKEKYFG